MRIIASLSFAVRVAAFVLNTVVCWSCLELEALMRRRKKIAVINTWIPLWAKVNLWIFGVKFESHGPFADEGKLVSAMGANRVGRIFVANHRSGMDIPILFAVAETHVISRHDLANWPLIGPGARRIGTLFVDRSSRRSGAAVLREVDRVLAEGEGVAMFPEGTAHPGDEVREFQPGAFNAARRAGAEVVPLGLAYSDEAAYYGYESFMDHIKRVASLRRLRVAVEIGEPLQLDDCENSEMKDIAQKRVQELVDRARARLESH